MNWKSVGTEKVVIGYVNYFDSALDYKNLHQEIENGGGDKYKPDQETGNVPCYEGKHSGLYSCTYLNKILN